MRLAIILIALAACGDNGKSAGDAGGDDVDASGDGQTGIDAGYNLPLETWSWLDVPGMVCGNGSQTGIAVNPSTRSQKLVILFEGGGGCWEAAACYGIVIPVTASHLDGFNATTFAQVRPQIFDSSFMFQRTDPASLFHDATWVFVPYCTGDIHSGTRDNVYEALGQMRTMHHRGGNNVDAMLSVVKNYPASEVFAMGISAGGFGIQLNWDRIAAVFPNVTTHAFADGSQMVPIEGNRYGTMNAAWGARFPAGCNDCNHHFENVAALWRAAPPPHGGRFGLIDSLQDGTLSVFFGYNAADMKTQSLIIGNAMTGTQAAFMVDDNSHTRLAQPATQTQAGVVLKPWVEAWANGTAGFTTVGP